MKIFNLLNQLIDMLKNPFKYHKKDINVDKIYSAIYQKQKEFKTKIGQENNIEFNDLKNTYSKTFNHQLVLMKIISKKIKSITRIIIKMK